MSNAQNFQKMYEESRKVFDQVRTLVCLPPKVGSEPKQELKYQIGDKVEVYLDGEILNATIRAIDTKVFDMIVTIPYYAQIGNSKDLDTRKCFWFGENEQNCPEFYIIERV